MKRVVPGIESGIGVEFGVRGGVVKEKGLQSNLRKACSAIIRIRQMWSSAANLSFSAFNLLSVSCSTDSVGRTDYFLFSMSVSRS